MPRSALLPGESRHVDRTHAALADAEYRRKRNAAFWAKVDKSGDCWLWTAGASPKGYGHFGVRNPGGNRLVLAHIYSKYLELGEPWPEGLILDHVCRNRLCVRPAHLELVTDRENVARGDLARAMRERWAARTHCKRGHEYNEQNTRITASGTRQCRLCARVTRAARTATT